MISHAPFYLDFLWNTHSWYKITNYWDFARAVSWCLANLITAWCYIAIPWEISYWRKELKTIASSLVGIGFIVFIFLCGMHHIVDVIIMPTAPWWAIIWVNIPMALASVATWLYIKQYRGLIIQLLHGIEDFLEEIAKK